MVMPRDRFFRNHAPRTYGRGVGAASVILLAVVYALGQNSNGNQGLDFRNTAPGVSYVGSETCRACHSAIYETYSRTDMARTTFAPNQLVDLGWLTKPVDVFNARHNLHYQIYARDAKVFQSEYSLDEQGKELFRHTEELAYVIGTGANGATPIVRRGNFLFEAPLSYYAATKSWDLSPNFEVRDMGFSLPITADCVGCHTGRNQPVLSTEGLFKDPPVLDMGISCEKCHGPGQLHVKERLAGLPVSGKIDRSIVNPAKLPPWLADNICISCHEGDIRALQPGKYDSDFRPGTPVDDTVAILKSPIDPRATQSPLLEHYYSMTLSACYRESGGKLGCQSCHDPHVQMSSLQAPTYFRAKCLSCHTEKSCTLDLQKRLVLQPTDACASCHMAKRPALTVSHAALTDHRILRTPDEPYPDSAFRESLPGTGLIHVNAVPGRPDTVPGPLLLNAYRQEIIRSHLEFKDDYFSLLDRLSKSANQDPFVLSAIAQKAASDGDLPKAIDYARQVIDRGSGSVSDYLLLDIFLSRSGDLEGCIKVLQKGISVAPYSNFLYENLAIRQLSSGHVDDGLETLRKGLELFPEDSALQNMKQQAAAQGLLH